MNVVFYGFRIVINDSAPKKDSFSKFDGFDNIFSFKLGKTGYKGKVNLQDNFVKIKIYGGNSEKCPHLIFDTTDEKMNFIDNPLK